MYEILVGGKVYYVSGTYASTPAVAGLVTLVNAERAVNGHPPVGFMNQVLYSTAVDFTTDITSGTNQCAAQVNGVATCCASGTNGVYGFNATVCADIFWIFVWIYDNMIFYL